MVNSGRIQHILVYRCLGYIFVTILMMAFSHLIFEKEAIYNISFLFMLFMFPAVLQFIYSLWEPSGVTLYALFVVDAIAIMSVVKLTGGSNSPMLVLFPVLSLSGSVVFRNKTLIFVLTTATLIFMLMAIGFGPSIFGNAFAIISTGLLGGYLSQTLLATDKKLELSEGIRGRLEKLQEAIMANIPSGLVSSDNTGKIIQVNPKALEILNIERETVVGKMIKDLFPQLEMFRKSFTLPDGVREYKSTHRDRRVFEFQRGDSTTLKLGFSLAPLKDPKKHETFGTLIVFQDLTKIIKLEEDLRLSEKLAAVGKLAAGIAHEIRNPLASISGSAQLLQSIDHLHDEDASLLDIIVRESRRLDSLITEFLEYVKPTKVKMDQLSLVDICEELKKALSVNQKWIDMGTDLSIVSEQDNVVVLGQKDKIMQILMNFALNAGQAGAKKVVLKLSDRSVLEINDDGSGIKEQDQAHIFEPFFTTKEKGTGLGLAICYRLLEAMGARVIVKSPIPELFPSGGTQFRIEFKGVDHQNESHVKANDSRR